VAADDELTPALEKSASSTPSGDETIPMLGQDPPQADFRIVKGQHDPLSNFFPFQLDFDGIEGKSVEHVFDFIRASEAGNVDLAEKIWKAKDAMEVKRIVKRHNISSSPEFELWLMEKLLEKKAVQCPEFLEALLSSGEAILYHSTYPSDTFWATGLCHWDFAVHAECFQDGFVPGQNMHGVLLMQLRSRLGSQATPSGSVFGPGFDVPSPLALPTVPFAGVASTPQPARARRLLSPLLKEKPRSLMDVEVDPRFVMSWFYKHGYFMSPSMCACNTVVPFRLRPTARRM
jgi:predicted NAD-dependent protein-ADP-ribosyltransferase YbiA (DUF1768 family)